MAKNKKIEELIPDLLRQISQGIGISVNEVAGIHNLSADGIKKKLRDVRDNFYKDCFDYDGSTRKWVVLPHQIGFLHRELLEPEETVVLTALNRTSDRLGKGLVDAHKKIVENYTKRTKSYTFKQHISENITEDMEQIFALLKHAINKKNIVELNYPSKDKIKRRRIFPYRVVYIEYYWYLICYEENEKIKSFRLSLISSPKILDKIYTYNFTKVDMRLDLAMNAYIDYQEPFKTIEILVHNKIVAHVDLASYFSSWQSTNEITMIHDITYIKFNVKATNPQYDDIIPTILKYMPYMIIESDDELKKKINKRIGEYLNVYKIQ